MPVRVAIRRYYKCPCDGESHNTIGREVRLPVVRAMADLLTTQAKAATGMPIGDGCIWQALKDPVVRSTEERWIFLRSNPALYLNDDMPGVLFDAAKQYHIMRINAENYFAEKRKEKAEKERNQKAAQTTNRLWKR